MTDEERALLYETAEKTKEIHDALFKPFPDGQPAFMDRAASVVVAAERGSWAVKWTFRIIISIGALVGVVKAILTLGGKP